MAHAKRTWTNAAVRDNRGRIWCISELRVVADIRCVSCTNSTHWLAAAYDHHRSVVSLLVRSLPDITGGGEELVMELLQSLRALEHSYHCLLRARFFQRQLRCRYTQRHLLPIVAFGAVSGLSFAHIVWLVPSCFGARPWKMSCCRNG